MISRNWTSFVSNSLILCHGCRTFTFISRLLTFRARYFTTAKKILFLVECFWSEGKIRSKSVSTKLLLPRTPKKVGPKVAYFYCMKTYRDWPQIHDPQILTVGNPIESEDTRLLGHLFFGVRGSNSIVDTLLLRIFPSDQKQKSRNCIKFAGVNFLVLNVDSRREKN